VLSTPERLLGERLPEHAAVRELAVRPFSPRHPILAVDATHAFFSPYHLAIALAARATGASPISALAIAGLVNIVLLVLALRRFLVRLLPEGAAATPYALVFILLLWGRDAWWWSGFLHIDFLPFVVPYPSTFAAAGMFLGLSLLLDALDHGRVRAFGGIAILVAVCVIIHPPTAVVLFAGLAALFVARAHTRWLINGAFSSVPSWPAWRRRGWPYFPVLSLLVAPPGVHRYGAVFYQRVPAQIWPALLALGPRVATPPDPPRPAGSARRLPRRHLRLRRHHRRVGLGRVIAYIVVFILIALACAVATWECRLPARRAWLVPAYALLVAGVFAAYHRGRLVGIVRAEAPTWPAIEKILAPVAPEDVVLTDSRTSYVVPALTGGHVIGWRHPLYWIPDHTERRQALERFFAAADDDRRALIARYHVKWILLDRRQVALTPTEEQRLLALGSVAPRESLVLLAVAFQC
jgi:hypothetical protein